LAKFFDEGAEDTKGKSMPSVVHILTFHFLRNQIKKMEERQKCRITPSRWQCTGFKPIPNLPTPAHITMYETHDMRWWAVGRNRFTDSLPNPCYKM